MSATIMKAVQVNKYGGPEVYRLVEIPRPRAAANEILVRVYAIGINSIDWKLITGILKDIHPLTFPRIPGEEFAGVIEEIGSEVTNFQVGQEVYGIGRHVHEGGCCAEYTLTLPEHVMVKPKHWSFDKAASVSVASQTAWEALFDRGYLTAGQRVLIHNAAGAVGNYAIQLAHWKGAEVFTTTSTPNVDFARSLGADTVIDYRTTPFEEVVNNVDLVLDGVGGETRARSWQTLKRGGKLISIVGPISEAKAREYGVQAEMFTMSYRRDRQQKITGLIEAGILKNNIFDVFSIQNVQAAYALSMQAHGRGKIVLSVD